MKLYSLVPRSCPQSAEDCQLPSVEFQAFCQPFIFWYARFGQSGDWLVVGFSDCSCGLQGTNLSLVCCHDDVEPDERLPVESYTVGSIAAKTHCIFHIWTRTGDKETRRMAHWKPLSAILNADTGVR